MKYLMIVKAEDRESSDALAEETVPGIGVICHVRLSEDGNEPVTNYWTGFGGEYADTINDALASISSYQSFVWDFDDIAFSQTKLTELELFPVNDNIPPGE